MLLEDIKKTIEASIPGSTVYVFDPMNDGQHFQAIVISPHFEGMVLVQQHHLVMKALKEALSESVHALTLKTFTPRKWHEVRRKYQL